MTKYIKGKDGKFKGSLPAPTSVPKTPTTYTLPNLPVNPLQASSKPSSLLAKATVKTEDFEEVCQKDNETVVLLTEVEQSSFYISSQDIEFNLPSNIASQIERGNLAYFKDAHILYTDSYGDNNASHYPAFPPTEDKLINFTDEKYAAVVKNINEAETFSDLSEEVKDYFKLGGCAALAVAIYERLPGSNLGVVVAAIADDPSDATAAHVYVTDNRKIYDASGATRVESFDFVTAAGVDPDLMDVLAYDTTPDAVKGMISHGCFGNNFHKDSEPLIGKIAELIIKENN
jgi:hypothetical protein